MTQAFAQLRSSMSADRVGGLIWFVFGVALTYGSWTMDRLASQGVAPITAPGLVPGLLGIGIIAFSLVLMFRRGQVRVLSYDGATGAPESGQAASKDQASEEQAAKHQPSAWRRFALSWLLCMIFAGVLLGRGLPFWLLAGGFVFAHIMLLEDPERVAAQSLPRRLLNAGVIAAATSAVVSYVFQHIFLIRLP
jgi:hypothetical protein